MRFMVIVKATEESEAGILPDEKLLTAMGKYNEDLVKAGVMLAADGLHPSSKGARIQFSGGKATVTDGPFAETKELIAGFWLWRVNSKEEAIEWLNRSPFDGGAEIEIRQVFEAEDFGPSLTPELREQEQRLRQEGTSMEMKLQLVPLPVSDVDRAKSFYIERLGFTLDHDVQPGNGMRVVQLTPPGSACSIVIGTGMFTSQPGSVKGLHLVVADVGQARERLAARGVDVSEVDDMGGVKYAYFNDPDGNSWALQEIPGRHS